MKRKIEKLYRFDSRYDIVESYSFIHQNYFAYDTGSVYNGDKVISNGIPHLNGTIEVRLFDDDYNRRRFKLHQIMLQTFQPEGIKNGYTPDHINRLDRINNSLSNLRWAGRDIQYSNKDSSTHQYKKVYCPQTDTVYNSCQEAEKRLMLVKNTVSPVARGAMKSIKGYNFHFV